VDFKNKISVKKLASAYNCTLLGDQTMMASGINEIHRVRSGDITFVDVEKYFNKALSSAASIIIINKEVDVPYGKCLLVTDDPFSVYDNIIKNNRSENNPIIKDHRTNIHPSTVIEVGAVIGKNVIIGKNCYIQSHVYIANNTVIGDHVTIQANSSVGTQAFYFKKEEGVYHKWTTGGRVVLMDHVDIGSGCTINNGVSSDTIIGSGTKMDCQVHIGHGVIIGKNCLFAAQVGIAGKSIIEDNVVLYGQVGVAQNITIGMGAVVLAKSGVSKNLEGDKVYFGYPAAEAKEKYRELATLRRLARK